MRLKPNLSIIAAYFYCCVVADLALITLNLTLQSAMQGLQGVRIND